MASTTSTIRLSAEEFWRDHNGKRRELVDGRVVEAMPPGGMHGTIALRLGAQLERWAAETGAGNFAVESGFILSRDPDNVRSPDISFVAAQRIPASGVPRGFWTIAPDLAIEIVSPSDKATEIRAKINDYLAAGVRSVWIVYPDMQTIEVHEPAGRSTAFYNDDELIVADLLPGFACKVRELFA